MGLFDKIGDVFEDVKDAVVDAAPVLLPIALSYFAPGMSLVGRQALGAGIGTLLKGGKPEDALKSAAIGGALGAVQGGIGGLMQDGQGFGAGMKGAFQRTDGTGIFGRPLRDAAGSDGRTLRESLMGQNQPPVDANQLNVTGDLQKSGLIANPFNSGPTIDEIYASPQFKTLTSPQLDAAGQAIPNSAMSADAAFKALKEEYTPSAFSRFGAPALGIAALAAISGDDEEEEEEYMETGADMYYADPDRYNINLYKEGGAVPNNYKGFSKLPEAVQEKIDPSLAAKYKAGGEAYPRRTGGIGPGLGSGTKDDVPALLMDGEFVMTRDAVKGAGGGSVKKGINRMYDVMRDLENKATA